MLNTFTLMLQLVGNSRVNEDITSENPVKQFDFERQFSNENVNGIL